MIWALDERRFMARISFYHVFDLGFHLKPTTIFDIQSNTHIYFVVPHKHGLRPQPRAVARMLRIHWELQHIDIECEYLTRIHLAQVEVFKILLLSKHIITDLIPQPGGVSLDNPLFLDGFYVRYYSESDLATRITETEPANPR